MSKLRARTLSLTFAPALIALVGFTGATLPAIEPQDVPAKAATTASVDTSATADGHQHTPAKHHKHKHHHKGQAGRK
jgi:hypothetical protein